MPLIPLRFSIRSWGPFHRMLWIGIWREYDAETGRLWQLLTDTHCWHRWGPSVMAVQCRQRWIRLGTQGHVQTVLGIRLPFVVSLYRHRRHWTWRVIGVTATGHDVFVGRGGRNALVFWVPAIAWPYLLICWWALHRIGRLLAHR